MEVYLLETLEYEEILLHISDTDLWFGTYGYEDYVNIESINFTQKFWDSVKEQQTDLLTYIGEL